MSSDIQQLVDVENVDEGVVEATVPVDEGKVELLVLSDSLGSTSSDGAR